MTLRVPLSHGDLCDRLTILEIKLCRITDPYKLKAVKKEHELLANLFYNSFVVEDALLAQLALLQAVNEQLWDIEDELRAHERLKQFDARFVGLARRVYHLNDKRASLKTSINLLCDSPIQEVKSYEEY